MAVVFVVVGMLAATSGVVARADESGEVGVSEGSPPLAARLLEKKREQEGEK